MEEFDPKLEEFDPKLEEFDPKLEEFDPKMEEFDPGATGISRDIITCTMSWQCRNAIVLILVYTAVSLLSIKWCEVTFQNFKCKCTQ